MYLVEVAALTLRALVLTLQTLEDWGVQEGDGGPVGDLVLLGQGGQVDCLQ